MESITYTTQRAIFGSCRVRVIWFCLILLTMSGNSQSTEFSVSEISFKPIPGNPSESSITSMIQDHQGFMWFGTRNGLNRYDGLEFDVYKHDFNDSTSLGNSYISSIYEDSHNNLWIGTWVGGLHLYQREQNTFLRFNHDPTDPKSLSHPRVHVIYEDSDQNLWIGTENGLNLFDPHTGTFTKYFHDEKDSESLAHSEVRVIAFVAQDRNWTIEKGKYEVTVQNLMDSFEVTENYKYTSRNEKLY